jgi:aminoglycoside phosphotransferase
MDELNSQATQWLTQVLNTDFTASKHAHSHQDEVYKIETDTANYYLKIAASLKTEYDSLKKLEGHLPVPRVVRYFDGDNYDLLLINELAGNNLCELIGKWSDRAIVEKFAEAVRLLHSTDAAQIFAEAGSKDVLLHGDMALPNLIISGQGDIGYIDVGQLAYGAPELDLVDAIWSLQRNIGPEYGKLFLEKYGPVEMTPNIEKALAYRYKNTTKSPNT